jgi:N-acetylneuraminic acid mutarotase
MIFSLIHRQLLLGLLILAGTHALNAQVPQMIDYQGKIAVSGTSFTGEGQFKFALVDGAGTTTYWSHDASSTAGSEPTTHIVRTVTTGLYSIVLGDTALLGSTGAAMQALTPPVFNNPDVRLRIWFNDGANGFQLLSPDRRIAAVAYALMADTVPDGSITQSKLAAGAVTSAALADGSITESKLAAGSVTSTQLAAGSVTADKLAAGVGGGGGGNIQASLSAADSTLIGDGYIKIQSVPAKLWETSAASGAPSPRSRHTAVWTGSKMMIWGGLVGVSQSNQGGTYDPVITQWSLLPTSGVSPARSDHTAVWTGERMIVWGGFTASGESNTGAMYAPPVPASDPPIGGWLATTTTAAPALRSGHTAVWTGTKMVIWGGKNGDGVLNDGGAYTPPTGPLIPGQEGSWTPLQSSGAPAARHHHTAVWAGTKMIVWGGLDSNYDPINDGAIYDPVTDSWTALPTSGAPSARVGHSAVWTGTQMLIFGGSNTEVPGSSANLLADGAAYDPVTDLWSPITSADAPPARFRHAVVWTGNEMLVFGGNGAGAAVITSAAAYRPETDTWRVLPASAATAADQTGQWSGSEVLVFGTNGLQILDPSPAFHLYGKF